MAAAAGAAIAVAATAVALRGRDRQSPPSPLIVHAAVFTLSSLRRRL